MLEFGYKLINSTHGWFNSHYPVHTNFAKSYRKFITFLTRVFVNFVQILYFIYPFQFCHLLSLVRIILNLLHFLVLFLDIASRSFPVLVNTFCSNFMFDYYCILFHCPFSIVLRLFSLIPCRHISDLFFLPFILLLLLVVPVLQPYYYFWLSLPYGFCTSNLKTAQLYLLFLYIVFILPQNNNNQEILNFIINLTFFCLLSYLHSK